MLANRSQCVVSLTTDSVEIAYLAETPTCASIGRKNFSAKNLWPFAPPKQIAVWQRYRHVRVPLISIHPASPPPLNQWNSVYLSFMRVGSDSASGETSTTKQVTIVPVRRPLFPADARTFHRRLLRCCHSGRVRCSKSANQNFLQGRKHLHLLSIGLCHCCVLLVLFGWVTM